MMQHWGGIQGANSREIWQLMRKSEKFRWTTKKGRQKFLSFAPGIQQPLHATAGAYISRVVNIKSFNVLACQRY